MPDSPALTIPDEGFAAIQIGDTAREVDLYHAYNHLQAARGRFGERMGHAEMAELQQTIKEFLGTIGFPGVSYYAALRFHNAVTAAVGNLRGNGNAGPTPGSPASTEPPPSDYPEE